MFCEGLMGFGAAREAKLTSLVTGRDGGKVMRQFGSRLGSGCVWDFRAV